MIGHHDGSPGPVFKLWELFRKIIPPDASPLQVKETRRAFYAGSLATYQLIVRLAERDEEAAMKVMAEIDDDIRMFNSNIGDGDAEN